MNFSSFVESGYRLHWSLLTLWWRNFTKLSPKVPLFSLFFLQEKMTMQKKRKKKAKKMQRKKRYKIEFSLNLLISSVINVWSGRASKRGIWRTEVRFLVGTQNFFSVPRSWQDDKTIFLYFFTEFKTYHLSYSIYSSFIFKICRIFRRPWSMTVAVCCISKM